MKRLFPIAAALVPVSAWAAEAPTEPYNCWGPQMMWGAGGYGVIFGPLFMILVLAVVIGAAILIVRLVGGPWHGMAPHHFPPGRTPVDILKERFARGEIDKDEFEERRRLLSD